LPKRNCKLLVGLILFLGLQPFKAEACTGIGVDARLSAYCQLQELSTTPQTFQTLSQTHQALTRIGFQDGIQLGPPKTGLNFNITASPTIGFSENINGGLPNGTLEIAGLSFTPDQNQIRQSGSLLGVELGAHGTYSLGRGSYLDFRVGANAQQAINQDLTVATFSFGGCGHFHLGSWHYLDMCSSRSIIEKDLLSERRSESSFGLSQLWSSSKLSHRLSAGFLLRSPDGEAHQTGISVESEFIGSNGLNGGITFEATNQRLPTVGHDYSSRLWLGGALLNRPIRIFADLGSSNEGQILGVDRIDRTTQIGLSYVPYANWVMTLGLTRTESSVDYFSTSSPILSLRYQALRF
jgi:hypothetical protein